jgi:hypothetical protein
MAWIDHQPIVPLYNYMTKPAPAKVNRHRNQIIDLKFKDKFLIGKANLTDYNFRSMIWFLCLFTLAGAGLVM